MRAAGKAIFYIAVMLPLWSNYLVRVYAWKLILAKEGAVTWLLAPSRAAGAARLGAGDAGYRRRLARHLDDRHHHRLRLYLAALHGAAAAGGAGARAALADRGLERSRRPAARHLPQGDPAARDPGVAAGSIFTFSLTLGDYIIPNMVGSSRPFIGQLVYQYQGTASNLPLAAAFAVVPIVIMAVYLSLAKRLGAFDAL